jgi:hypothetical protein
MTKYDLQLEVEVNNDLFIRNSEIVIRKLKIKAL